MTIPRKQWRLNLGSRLVFVINSFIVLRYSNHYDVYSKQKNWLWIYEGSVLKNIYKFLSISFEFIAIYILFFDIFIFNFIILGDLLCITSRVYLQFRMIGPLIYVFNAAQWSGVYIQDLRYIIYLFLYPK